MKQTRIFSLLTVLIFTVTAPGRGTTSSAGASAPQAQQSQQPPGNWRLLESTRLHSTCADMVKAAARPMKS